MGHLFPNFATVSNAIVNIFAYKLLFVFPYPYEYVLYLNKFLKENLNNYDNVYINSNDNCIPHILNISIKGVKPETMLHALEKYEVYISTQTACSSEKSISKAVLALTKDEERAKSSIRISLSYKTTKEELEEFLRIFDKCYKELMLK